MERSSRLQDRSTMLSFKLNTMCEAGFTPFFQENLISSVADRNDAQQEPKCHSCRRSLAAADDASPTVCCFLRRGVPPRREPSLSPCLPFISGLLCVRRVFLPGFLINTHVCLFRKHFLINNHLCLFRKYFLINTHLCLFRKHFLIPTCLTLRNRTL